MTSKIQIFEKWKKIKMTGNSNKTFEEFEFQRRNGQNYEKLPPRFKYLKNERRQKMEGDKKMAGNSNETFWVFEFSRQKYEIVNFSNVTV